MRYMNTLFIWTLFGLVVGASIHIVETSSKKGIIQAMLLGIAGALVGGFLANVLFGQALVAFDLTTLMIAISGSLILLFIGRALTNT